MYEAETRDKPKVSFGEFVALCALLQAAQALGVDTMLPALGTMRSELHVARANNTQWVITASGRVGHRAAAVGAAFGSLRSTADSAVRRRCHRPGSGLRHGRST